ncbi:MAG TPA: SDR family NAD(P)-dependent oxidoreductase, partial [Thermoleophilaceae bacterium]|nr:SDR family NAD(P)-dependent oxidoreductase [Thermoleophilaceae bacterium]
MKVFVTGATGFIGGRMTHLLAGRGDEVTALVRDPAKADDLAAAGVRLIQGDLTSLEAIEEGVRGADAVVHGAAVYKVGIPAAERDDMFDANVRGTARVLDAAIEANVPRIVYVSSVVAFGDTEGATVTEDHVRPHRRFSSFYEETKVLAHEIADERITRGAPIVMVQPGGVYGPGDHSQLGTMIHQAATGKLKMKMLPEAGYLLAYVDDVAAGILGALDAGEIGESYVLGGECVTMGELVDRAAAAAGRKGPRATMPTPLIKASAP